MTSAEDPILRDLEIMAGAVRYRAWIHSLLAPFLGRRIVEVGSGIGTFTELLLERGEVVATDVYPPAVERLRSRFAGRPGFEARLVDVSAPHFRELSAFRPDTMVCSNVLEHVRDDRTALAAMREVLAPGGHLVLLVPAFQAAFGTIDRLVGHERRYGRAELRGKLAEAGFELRKLHYVNAVALPAWFVNGRVLKRQEESPGQVLVFDRLVVPWLSRLERLVAPPFGMSLFAAARR